MISALFFAATPFTPIAVLPPNTIITLQQQCQCRHANGNACASGDLKNSYYRQALILATGFENNASDESDFFTDFNTTVDMISDPDQSGTIWSVQKAPQMLYIGCFTPGGPLGDTAAFGGKVFPHPIRGFATTLSQDAVYSEVTTLQSTLPGLNPMTCAVLFNSFQTGVTANAAPPSFLNEPFGVAKYTREDLIERGAYVPSHEMAHAGLNYLDEYTESGFENLDLGQLDILTPLILLDDSWSGLGAAIDDALGIYSFKVSEILAANGNDNVATTEFPATVIGPGYLGQDYHWEGGFFFGLGTWHMSTDNLMNGGNLDRGPGDGFGYAMSPSQQTVVDEAFGGPVSRPNDRLHTAGPNTTWFSSLGSTTHVLLYDGDKLHHFHPTLDYNVQVTWEERHWSVCWAFIFPYPCHTDTWQTAQTTVPIDERSVSLQVSAAFGLASLLQQLVCAVGFTEIKTSDADIKLCQDSLATMANAFLPTFTFRLPYQDVPVPASQWMTTYYWRFSTNNGAFQSAYTGWSSFYRSL